MVLFKTAAASAALLATRAVAKIENVPRQTHSLRLVPPVVNGPKATSGQATFQQYIDHNNQSLGTFSQTYWWNDDYCTTPNCPVVLFTPGEVNATAYQDYLTTSTLTGQFAQAIGGAVILLEHRYWGNSSPYTDLSTENLQYLTLYNSIQDLTNFAKTVQLPFANGQNADKAPWVLSGGSYSGALAAWTASTAPGTFWAYHATSAPVEAISDYWQYFEPIQEGMPQNCSTDINLVIDYIDTVLTTHNESDQVALKSMFGLGDLANDDFGAAIAIGPSLWQGNQFYINYGFFDFCDAVENAGRYATTGSSATGPGAGGIGLEKALAGYANWFNGSFALSYCEGFGYADWDSPMNTACFDTHNASSPMYTDTTLSNSFDRQWQWFLCNEPFGYWQDGAPANQSTLTSRLVTVEYWQRQCPLFFPTENGYSFGSAEGKNETQVNAFTGGWDITNTTRLIWANGQFDPWRNSGVSSTYRPGGPLASTSQEPINIIPGGFHCSDLDMSNANANAGVNAVVQDEIQQIVTWVKQWPGSG